MKKNIIAALLVFGAAVNLAFAFRISLLKPDVIQI